MSESSLLDRLVKERLEKNMAETKQEDILRILHKRFGSAPRDVVKGLKGIPERDQLNALLDLAADCPNLESFRGQFPS